MRGVVQMQSPQQQVTQMFRARSNAARMAVLRGKITAPTSYDVQHERVGAASEHRAVSGMKRSARTAEIPSPAKPPLQRMAGADENKHASPRRGLNFDLMDF